jgi:DNA repair exonuclease SbcCD ATPase subunit
MDEQSIGSEIEEKLEDDVNALFKLPLAEFTGSRNDLAARLKRAGRANDASLVKALGKPSVSAWAVNQLYWNHRDAFDQLLITSQRFREAPTSNTAGKTSGLHGSLTARRDALSHLSDLASALLLDAGHNPTPDTIHRITTTLEAISAFASASDRPTLGRLTHDVDPPGFESLASLITGTHTTERKAEPARVTRSQETSSAATKPGQGKFPASDLQKAREAEERRRAGIAAAKVALQEARRSLTEARSVVQRLDAAHKKARAEAKEADAKTREAEKQLRKAEERFKKTRTASEDAAHRAQSIAAETEQAAQAVEDARRTSEKASKELESLLQESASK